MHTPDKTILQFESAALRSRTLIGVVLTGMTRRGVLSIQLMK